MSVQGLGRADPQISGALGNRSPSMSMEGVVVQGSTLLVSRLGALYVCKGCWVEGFGSMVPYMLSSPCWL